MSAVGDKRKLRAMEQAITLLLDFNQTSGLGTAVREILESARFSSLRLQHKYICTEEPSAVAQELADLISRCRPDLVFLILAPGYLKQGRLWLKSLSRTD